MLPSSRADELGHGACAASDFTRRELTSSCSLDALQPLQLQSLHGRRVDSGVSLHSTLLSSRRRCKPFRVLDRCLAFQNLHVHTNKEKRTCMHWTTETTLAQAQGLSLLANAGDTHTISNQRLSVQRHSRATMPLDQCASRGLK
jgi:hypothetical protein